MSQPFKVIDLFAGPGGLGEGFSSFGSGKRRSFKIAASVEMEPTAHSTLTLRAFYRQFQEGSAPDDYYEYLKGTIERDTLFNRWPKEAALAREETLERPTALGRDNAKIDSAIAKALGNTEDWVLIGGPPCQAYSLVGRSRNKGKSDYRPEKDERNFLYQEYLRIIAKFQPSVFVMENVKGMLSARVNGNSVFDSIMDDLESPGRPTANSTAPNYRIYSLVTPHPEHVICGRQSAANYVIRSEKFGIPQTRHRVILLGIRDDISFDSNRCLLSPSPPPGLQAIIGDLPRLRSGISKSEDSNERWLTLIRNVSAEIADQLADEDGLSDIATAIRKNFENFKTPKNSRGKPYIRSNDPNDLYQSMSKEYQGWYQDQRLSGVLNHETRSHISEDLSRYIFCSTYAGVRSKSPRLSEFPDFLLPNHANASSGKFVDRFKVQMADRPASTITSHISKDGHYFIHPDPTQARALTVREAARIQTFPDNYFFEGGRTQQYVQAGNAVPPLLARNIAKIVANIMES